MMTKAQLKKIEEIIRKRFIALRHDTVGVTELTPTELQILKDMGILRKNVKSFVASAYDIGRIISRVSPGKRGSMTYEQILRDVGKPRLSETEKNAISFAESSAGEYIKTLEASVISGVKSIISNGVASRKTISEVTTELFNSIDKSNVDFRRIATTETSQAVQRGISSTIREAKGDDALVYKILDPRACEHCKRLYLKGGKPKVFKLSELEDSNFGRKAADWVPVVGPTHPSCYCTLAHIPAGFDFDDKGELVFVGKGEKK